LANALVARHRPGLLRDDLHPCGRRGDSIGPRLPVAWRCFQWRHYGSRCPTSRVWLDEQGSEHFEVLAANALTQTSQQWRVERGALPDLGKPCLRLDQLARARQVRVATMAAILLWAESWGRH